MNNTDLQKLLSDNTENEVLEFKEAKNSFDVDKLGKYFSALSNEANLAGKDKAYLLFGVKDDRTIVGTNISDETVNTFKLEVSKNTSPTICFLHIDRIKTANGAVLCCVIPAAPHGVPIAWKDLYYGRAGESLGGLNIEEIQRIINQTRYSDWSAQIVPNAGFERLSPKAIELARKMYAEKNPRLAEDIARWDDETFLNNARLTRDGKITNATILLLGKRDSEDLILPALSQITWILKDRDGLVKDYEHFFCPLIISAEQVRNKIRNLTYRYMTGESIFPKETLQYDPYVIREALNNCIAHQDYTRAGRITVQEHEDGYLIFCNCGDFIPKNIENVLKAEYSASNYRNPFLAAAMVNLNMIDTVGSGVLKMFLAQKKRCFPLPDYDFSNHEVRMKLYGKLLDINYTRQLQDEDLSIEEVLKLDRKQKEMFADGRIKEVDKELVEESGREMSLNVPKNTEQMSLNVPKNTEQMSLNVPKNGLLTKREEQVLAFFKEDSLLTAREIASKLDVNEKTIKRDISSLKERGFLERIGGKNGGRWCVLVH